MKAMAKIPAVTSAMGTPCMDRGMSSNSSRSRIPAKSTSARAILMIQKEFNLLQSVTYSVATAIGFALALVLFAGIRCV